MQLTKNFTLEELLYSETARKNNIDNTPKGEMKEVIETRLKNLATFVLQPVRDKFGPVTVSAGWQCQALSDLIRKPGSYSQHQEGYAADIQCRNASALEVARWISRNLKFDQVIAERRINKVSGKVTEWVHVSWKSVMNNRMQVLHSPPDGKYYQGIPVKWLN